MLRRGFLVSLALLASLFPVFHSSGAVAALRRPVITAEVANAAARPMVKVLFQGRCDFVNIDPRIRPLYVGLHGLQVQIGLIRQSEIEKARTGNPALVGMTAVRPFAASAVAWYGASGKEQELLLYLGGTTGRAWGVTIDAKPSLHLARAQIVALTKGLLRPSGW